MKVPAMMHVYCPHCKKHTEHKVKEHREGTRRSLAWGQIKHERKTYGYTSKIAGQVRKVKQRKKSKLMLECIVCHKKVGKIYPDSKKKVEIVKKEA
jgi:large subunit ribosomal protein L44e